MIEPEMAFHDLKMNADLAEEFIKYIIRYALEHNREDIEFLGQRLVEEDKAKPQNERQEMTLLEKLEFVVNNDFERVTYTEAVEILMNSPAYKKKKFQYEVSWGIDLQSEHERYLVEKHFKKPVIVTDYPKDIKAFYMRLNDDGKPWPPWTCWHPASARSSAAQREERMEILVERMKTTGIEEEDLWWYLDTRRFGSCPHAGFGLGFERMVQFVTGMGNIRDVIPFPSRDIFRSRKNRQAEGFRDRRVDYGIHLFKSILNETCPFSYRDRLMHSTTGLRAG
jgi:asparaginyl-tRNA synthetase